MLPHIQVTRRSDRQDSCDQPKPHTKPNRTMPHLQIDHQRRAIRKIPTSSYSPTNPHNRHFLSCWNHIQSSVRATNPSVLDLRFGARKGRLYYSDLVISSVFTVAFGKRIDPDFISTLDESDDFELENHAAPGLLRKLEMTIGAGRYSQVGLNQG